MTPGTFATNDGGTVTVQADGDFVFEPAAGTSCTDTQRLLRLHRQRQTTRSATGTDTGRVTIAITGCVWYVNNNDAQGNNGTSEKPFDTLAQAETASSAGHTIFVYDGDDTTTGYTTGFNLKASQKLIGEAAALTVGADTLHSADAANKPTITDNNADVVDLDDGNEVRGLSIDPQGTGGGIAGAPATPAAARSTTSTSSTPARRHPARPRARRHHRHVQHLQPDGQQRRGTTRRPRRSACGSTAPAPSTSPRPGRSRSRSAAPRADRTGRHGTNMGTGSVFDDITVTGSGTGGVSLATRRAPQPSATARAPTSS